MFMKSTAGRISQLPNPIPGRPGARSQGRLLQHRRRRKNRNRRSDRRRKILADPGPVPDPGIRRRVDRHRRHRHREDRAGVAPVEADHHPAGSGLVLRNPQIQYRPLPGANVIKLFRT
jgi:hypothetical protein